MVSRSSDRSAQAFFRMRLIQLFKEPVTGLVPLGGIALVALTTFAGPLPPLDGGLAWRDLLGPCGVLVGWVFALFLVWSPTGRLWKTLQAHPTPLPSARAWWALAETLVLGLCVLPGLVVGCVFLPGGPSLVDWLLVLAVLGQVLVLGRVGAFVRDLGLGISGGLLALTGVLLLFNIPPFSLADPRPLLRGSLGVEASLGSLTFWLSSWALIFGLEQAVLFSGQPRGVR